MGYRQNHRSNKTLYTILILVCIVGFWLFENFYTPASYTNPAGGKDASEVPVYLQPGSTTGHVIHHEHFMLSYSEPYEQAEWVAYVLKRAHLTYDDRKRPYFIEDPKVKTKSADWRNYRGSGYDRGHLCPAGDRRFSEYAYNETFYTSNISPQDRDFNAGLWNRLEMKIRQWAKQYGELVVITGGVLEDGLEEIGAEDVAVPRRFYKIVARGYPDDLKVVAFLMQGEESARPLKTFLVPVDEIETSTGLDFFQQLSDSEEDSMETRVDSSGWNF